jgi:phage terminase large subunit-like protein
MTTVALDGTTLQRWRANPTSFVTEVLHDPETGKPFVLLDAERDFMRLSFALDADGRLLYPEQCYSAPKKSGKTTLAALIVLTMVLLRSEGRFVEGYVCANDLEQAMSRTFAQIRRIVECSPLLKAEAKITADKISFPGLDASIVAIASDAASAAGASPCISCFDELWAFTTERARRLWDEMVTTPTRKISCRLVTTYAGFSGESQLLEQLYQRGMALPEIGPSLHAGDGMLMAWHTQPIAPWQDERWLAEMRRSLRPSAYQRMIENRFVEPASRFVDLALWDQCVQPSLTPVHRDKSLAVWVGVDASTKRDHTALVAVGFDRKTGCVRLVQHRVFVPTPGDPIDFEDVEKTLFHWNERFRLQQVLFDPNQLASLMQRLAKARLPVEEFTQTSDNMTAATTTLFDLINARNLVLYPDAEMRLAVSRAVFVETSRGQRLDRTKQSHKIDSIVALSMAVLAAVRADGKPKYNFDAWVSDDDLDLRRQEQRAFNRFVMSGGTWR